LENSLVINYTLITINKKMGLPMKALVVEDDNFQSKIAVTMLNMFVENGQIDAAFDCQSAREKFKNTDYDIIFMDYGLPDGNGADLTREFRKNGVKSKIYVLSGNWDKISDDVWREAGFDGGSFKPLSSERTQAYVDAFNHNALDQLPWDNSYPHIPDEDKSEASRH